MFRPNFGRAILKTAYAATEHRFPSHDRSFLRELQGKRPRSSLETILRKALRLRAGEERKALIYYRSLPRRRACDTEDPFVDDELLAALIRIRAGKPRWEAAWHLRGDIRVAPGHPLVFANNRFVPGSAGFDEDLATSFDLAELRTPPDGAAYTSRRSCNSCFGMSGKATIGTCFTTSSRGLSWRRRSTSTRRSQSSFPKL